MSKKKATDRKKARKQKLYEEQGGQCIYCGKEMLLTLGVHFSEPPKNLATIEHLDDKFSSRRGAFMNSNVPRTALACLLCNKRRGMKRQRTAQRLGVALLD